MADSAQDERGGLHSHMALYISFRSDVSWTFGTPDSRRRRLCAVSGEMRAIGPVNTVGEGRPCPGDPYWVG
jgi:hypothetical protein